LSNATSVTAQSLKPKRLSNTQLWFKSGTGSLINIGLTFLSGVIVTRQLSAVDRASLAEFMYWPQLMTLLCIMGFPDGYLREELSRKIFISCFTGIFAIYFGCLIFCFGAHPDVVIYGSLLYLIYIPRQLHYSHLSKTLLIGTLNTFYVLSAFFYLALVLLSVLLKSATVTTFMLSSIAAESLVFLCVFFYFRRTHSSLNFAPHRTFREGIPPLLNVHIQNSINLLNRNLDKIVILFAFSGTDVANYIVAAIVPTAILNMLSKASQDIIFPRSFNKSYNGTQLFKSGLLFFIPVLIFSAAFYFKGGVLIQFIYGDKYSNLNQLLSALTMLLGFNFLRDMLFKFSKGTQKVFSGYFLEGCYLGSFALLVFLSSFLLEMSALNIILAAALANMISLMIFYFAGLHETKP
jgi:hypothetical protein